MSRRAVRPGVATRGSRCIPSGQLLEDQLADPAGVGLATHLLHHRADEGAGGGVLAGPDPLRDVGVGGDRVVDRLAEGALGAAVDTAIAANPDVAEKIRAGKHAAAGALIGVVMKEMRGQADAGRVRELILEKLT